MQLFPAILVGGPPHSGKSVLAYSLSQALRQCGVEHYLLRACPDGEGDWANEIDQSRVWTIRIKGDWTSTWVKRISRDIANRHLPLLVDVGGCPTLEQQAIFSRCTHAVLLTPTSQARDEWRGYAQQAGLTLLAEFESSLTKPDSIHRQSTPLQGTLHGLKRGTTANSPAFQTLANKVAAHLFYNPQELNDIYLSLAPEDNVVTIEQLQQQFNIGSKWQPHHISQVLNELKPSSPLSLYGRAPNWLYIAIALYVHPAPFHQFDARLGWIAPPVLTIGKSLAEQLLKCNQQTHTQYTTFTFSLPQKYLDITEAEGLVVPLPPEDKGLVISGPLPMWLFTALATVYRNVPFLAIHQPQTGSVVVNSQLPSYIPGQILTP